jgi:mRNA interferase MazF
VVVIPFPFSDLTTAKRRPAMVLATTNGDDKVLDEVIRNVIEIVKK